MNLFEASSNAIEGAQPLAIALALLFGVASSFGPCMLSRVAIVGSQARGSRAWLGTTLFLAGIICVYVTFALLVGMLDVITWSQGIVNIIAAAVFGIAGIYLLFREVVKPVSTPVKHQHEDDDTMGARRTTTLFGLGVLAGLNLNPCCAPWLFMALAITARQHNVVFAVVLMVSFGIGHGLPLFLYGAAAQRITKLLDGPVLRTLIPLASVALMFWLAIYYGLQA